MNDKEIRDWLDMFGDYDSKKIVTECNHLWKEYLGFTEKYFYCTKCDKKESEKPQDVHNINKPWWA